MRYASLFLFVAVAVAAHAQERPKPEVVTELGAYYSSVGFYVPISADPFPDGGRLSEAEVYQQLLERSWHPNVAAFEASIYPMPILGVWLRKDHPTFYDIAPSVIQAVTAGFQEPWAVSAFFGSQMKFTRPEESERGTNRAHLGYLLLGRMQSHGNDHLKHPPISFAHNAAGRESSLLPICPRPALCTQTKKPTLSSGFVL